MNTHTLSKHLCKYLSMYVCTVCMLHVKNYLKVEKCCHSMYTASTACRDSRNLQAEFHVDFKLVLVLLGERQEAWNVFWPKTLPIYWQRFLLFGLSKVVPTEYTQSGNCRFLAHIHHDGNISPGWWGSGMSAHPPTVILVIITYKGAVYAPGERANTLPLFHLYPYIYSVVSLLHELL